MHGQTQTTYFKKEIIWRFNKVEITAEPGNPEDQVNLANMLGADEGVEGSFKKAVYWYKRAISNGSPEAAYNYLSFTGQD